MKGPFKVIDTNRHVVEPSDLWDNRIEKPYTGSHAVQVDLDQGSVLVSGRPVVKPRPNVMAHRFYQEAYKDAIQAGFTAESNLRDMDKEGVDVAILLPTVGLYAIWSDHIEGGLAAAMCRAYNDWLGEYCQADPARLKGVALLPLQDPGSAVTELRRAVQDLGLVAGFMRPNPLVGRKLHDPAYDVLYGEAQSLEVPILVSEMGGSVLHQIGTDRFDGFYSREAVLDPFEMMLGFLSFMGHNQLERFPRLKIGFLGAGSGWVPFWLDRADEHWGGPFGAESPSTQAPSILFGRQGFITVEPGERTIADVVKMVGDHCFVWGSQYPHPELTDFPDELDPLVNDGELSGEAKRKILWDNAAGFFGIG
jgi:predicted TIM-barrel fold metal-dependent hydrolase